MGHSIVALTFVLAILIEMALPLLLGLWAKKKFGISWKVFFLGAFFFSITQLFRIPVLWLIQPGIQAFITSFSLGTMLYAAGYALLLGLMVGLFEEPVRYLVFTRVFQCKKVKCSRENAIMFGLGWGGLQSMLIAVTLIFTLFSYISAVPLTNHDMFEIRRDYGNNMSDAEVDEIKEMKERLYNTESADIILNVFATIMNFVMQVVFCVLVCLFVSTGRKAYFAAAFMLHWFFEFCSIFIMTAFGFCVCCGLMLVIAAASVVFVWKKIK